MYRNIDYSCYLSIDNGNGILINRNDAYVLDKYKIDYKKYSNLGSLIFDINTFLSDSDDEELEELEEVLISLSECHYYNETNK